jgi:precorrin-2 dehydrogenase/sirohydrochlorin ferrochelatase
VVIAGSGEGAEAKARLFEGSPAVVARVEGAAAFLVGSYVNAALAFIASDDDGFAQAAASAARAAHVPVNVVDRPALCDFTTPAVIDRGEVVAAIGTGGASPLLASLLRNDIEARLPEGAGRVAALMRLHQDEVRAALPDVAARRAFLRSALDGPAARAAMAGDMVSASSLMREALQSRGVGEGRVRFLAGRGPVDLLTLRAARALAEADILVADEGANPAVIALARRDAERLTADHAEPDELIALAQAGRQVVRVVTAPVDPAGIAALLQAGVVVEVLASAPGG